MGLWFQPYYSVTREVSYGSQHHHPRPLLESHPDRHTNSQGMSQVQSWLKSLRLHKYGPLFGAITYDEMLSLTDEQLEARGVTRGARNKILVNIRKLHGRKQMLVDLESDIERDSSTANLRTVLNDLRGIIITPMKPEDELSSLFIQVLRKVFDKVFNHGEVDREVGSNFRWLTDRILTSDAFSKEQKRAVKCWRISLGRAISASRANKVGNDMTTGWSRPEPREPPPIVPLQLVSDSRLFWNGSQQTSASGPVIGPRGCDPGTVSEGLGCENYDTSQLESLCMSVVEQAIGDPAASY